MDLVGDRNLLFWPQLQRGGVDAEAKARWGRAVVENVPKMSIATTAKHLSADHAVRGVAMHLNVV